MANNNPMNSNNTRKTTDLLPGYHQTEKNAKFLSSTLDQFIQKPQLERLGGFIGSRLSLNYNPATDEYIDGGSKLRNSYQLEPSMVMRNNGDVYGAYGYDDLINKLTASGSKTDNLDRLFNPKTYSYDPCIDWDKFVNFRQYYWMPNGPDTVQISGTERAISTSYAVNDDINGFGLLFSSQGSEVTNTNPLLTLYRGSTYTFNVSSRYPFYIKTAYVRGETSLYSNAIGQGTSQVTIIVDDFTPNTLFYFAEGNDYAIGTINILRKEDATTLDVEEEILGKTQYVSQTGITFSNGMKVKFVGDIMPTTYQNKEFIVEGVGTSIALVEYDALQTAGITDTNLNVNFDATPFDQYPFDDFRFIPLTPEYITINRAAPDLNSWSRYNRWIHEDVIRETARANGVIPVYSVEMRATRPIIEFAAGLQLYNFGSQAKRNVDLIDTTTANAFALFEKSAGFYIDGVLVEQGFRVIFNADTDPEVRGKVYVVKFVTIDDQQVVNLEEAEDSEPLINNSVVVVRGTTLIGSNWWFNGDQWIFGQQKTQLNQPPLFDLYDDAGNKFSDNEIYDSSFKGTQLFGYAVGTGTPDPVLGFPLKYRNVTNVGDYLFENYFNTDTFTIFDRGEVSNETLLGNYLKVNLPDGSQLYRDIWVKTAEQSIPIIQFQVLEEFINFINVNAVDEPGYNPDLTIEVFIDDNKKHHNIDYIIERVDDRMTIIFGEDLAPNTRALIKLYTAQAPNDNGYYEVPSSLTNNPLNGPISDFTFTEISDHVKTIVDHRTDFFGIYPGPGNLRDLPNLSAYGTRLVSHQTPIAFSHYFLGTQENNLIDSVRAAAFNYNQYKTNLIRTISEIEGLATPAEMLDQAIEALAAFNKSTDTYNYSDMLAYGTNHSDRFFTVTHPRNTQYNLESVFNNKILSERSVLVYHNDTLLINDRDYVIDPLVARVTIKVPLIKGDVIKVSDYPSTVGGFVPPTPTKLGLYPKFIPAIYYDDTYVGEPRKVISGHDGSVILAYNDYRDDVILEFETRIYNNIKSAYNQDLFNIHAVTPGAFRNTDYSLSEFNEILTPDFLKWTGSFGVDYQNNSSFDETNPFTYNYSSTVDIIQKREMPGYWRAIYKYFYDTDRPHTHPWEMLGFSEKPEWWEAAYGPAPYTSGNLILWKDLEEGRIDQGSRAGVDSLYSRPGLIDIVPVDENGNLLDPTTLGLVSTPVINPGDSTKYVNLRSLAISNKWEIGDQGPAETAWRRSSYWPFVYQIVLALANPAAYSSLMFDPSRMVKNLSGQYRYGETKQFLRINDVVLFRDVVDNVRQLSSGYSVYVIEHGASRDSGYIETLKTNLKNINYNLMAKLGGFVSKEKLRVSIDAVDPLSPYPGVLLPSEDYQIFFNQSTPVESIGISGIIIQKTANGFIVRGYDKFQPYFTTHAPFPSNSDAVEQVGGRSEPYTNWRSDTTYNVGDVVFYLDRFYRVKQKHLSGSTFIATYYQSLPVLPQIGGTSVLKRTVFDTNETLIPYGTELSNIQDVYDLIVGYGRWLVNKGFVFNHYVDEVSQLSDWNYSAREFLYWTTQNWAINSIITLSPFADLLEYTNNFGVVDNILNRFNEYSLLKADGSPFPLSSFSVSRLDGDFKITVRNTTEGIFYARLNIIQKEHSAIFNNFTLFNDVIYDDETGYRQRRVNIKGFRTANWNGDFFSPGFVFDQAKVVEWEKYQDYKVGQTVKFSGKYYVAPKTIYGSDRFNFDSWVMLDEKPSQQLYPNFDYKIDQFEDFYSLDIDNFDPAQQAMAQHLIGYTPRPYLNNIIGDSIAQYKFYQGYIREKGTKNPLTKLSKLDSNSAQGSIDFNEEWAFRIGHYGGFTTYQEFETPLDPNKFLENPQIIEFVDAVPEVTSSPVYYKSVTSLTTTDEFTNNDVFKVVAAGSSSEVMEIPVAGYARFDDVTATAYNKNSILDIANNSGIQEGAVIWLGFTDNNDWDVLRYTNSKVRIVNVSLSIPEKSIYFTTDKPHSLNVGDLVSAYRIAKGIDQCYLVNKIVSPTEFVVFTTLTELPAITMPITGSLYVFKSVRLGSLQTVHNLPFLEDMKFGELLWVDSDENGHWKVYQKVNNYTSLSYENGINKPSQKFGYNITTDGDLIAASSPNYIDTLTEDQGRVFILSKQAGNPAPSSVYNFTLNDDSKYYTSDDPNGFGNSIFLDSHNNLVIVGAPLTSEVKQASVNTVVDPNTAATNLIRQGVVKLTLIDRSNRSEIDNVVITTPNPANNVLFGSSIAYSTLTNRLLIGSPGHNGNKGAIYRYGVTITSSSVNVSYQNIITVTNLNNSLYGSEIVGNRSLSRYAVTSPGYSQTVHGSRGAIYVYDDSTSTVQIITGDDPTYPSLFGSTETFGSSIQMSNDGNYLVVGSPYSNDLDRGEQSGIVDVFKWNPAKYQFTWHQRVQAPAIANSNTNFGFRVAMDDANSLAVSLTAGAAAQRITFDTYNDHLGNEYYVNDPNSGTRPTSTTFDNKSTEFYLGVEGAGSVHLYQKNGDFYSYSQELTNPTIESTSSFGFSLALSGTGAYVGAPAISNLSENGQIYIFDKIDQNSNGWSEHRVEEPLVDLSYIKSARTIDTDTGQIQQYWDIVDPVKGRIPDVARQELRFITQYDPATYSLGVEGVNVNPNTNWTGNHVGELWWDLSTVKFVWYEQGNLEYRKNNWNTIFPGCSIDVYEWVETKFLPSEWSVIADTPSGLALGISGQPKFIDNSVMSVRQVYNKVSNAFTNMYYYWVKNKTVMPSNVANRRISAFSVASQIVDPIRSGNNFIAITSPSSLIMANAEPLLQNGQISLNIAYDSIKDPVNRHTEWMILRENDSRSVPSVLLEKKLIDSLVGYDSLGNPVPDPDLPTTLSYGVEIRPRQSMFVNRQEALRNIIEFVNSVLITQQITGKFNFDNLEMKGQIPDSSLYDGSVVDIYELDLVPTSLLRAPELHAEVNSDGKLVNVVITNPGYGYLVAPTVTIDSESGSGATIVTEIDNAGQIISASIINPGSGYLPTEDDRIPLVVRPFTFVVKTDVTINGKWALYEWNYLRKSWEKIQTQSFDTTKFWTYTDWASTTYNPKTKLTATVAEPYEASAYLYLPEGSYIKIANGGDNRYIILSRRYFDYFSSETGTYDANWDLVYSEKGTIQFSDTLWNPNAANYAWDSLSGFDQVEFDYSSSQELSYVLRAIKDDLFIGENKIFWNQLFFKAVRYVFSEQKTIDWAFKTAFISVNGNMGELDQPATYKLQNGQNYEKFLEEIKPYHTKIRNFTEKYSSVDPVQAYTTDFDLPSKYDFNNNVIENIGFGDQLLLSYPWKSWYDNYTYGIESVHVHEGGANYYEVPLVSIITAPGDTGYGATAYARISQGKVIEVVITNPGTGYTVAPTIVFNGGGGAASTSSNTASTQLVSAKAYARLGVPDVMYDIKRGTNNVRTNNITIKFDRISTQREIGLAENNGFYTDTFNGDGEAASFNLTWVPVPDKNQIELKVNGVLQLIDSYTIDFYSKKYSPQPNTEYTKKYATLKLTFIPGAYDVVTVTYPKNQTLYNALDRIEDFYAPTGGMPGSEPSQLMTGMEYSGLQIDTLPFDAAGGWDVMPYGSSGWDNYSLEEGYVSFFTTTMVSQTFELTDLIISTGTNVNTYVNGVRKDSVVPQVNTLVGKGTGSVDEITVRGAGAGYVSGQVVVTISAPNMLNGIQATAAAVLNPSTGEITAINVINPGSGYTETPVVTITGDRSIQAYAVAVLKAEFTYQGSTQTRTSIILPATVFTTTSTLVEFRYATSDGTLQLTDLDSLDSVINGGGINTASWALSGALGITPSEIVLDGGSTSTRHITGMNDDGFLNPIDGYAPEECVAGQVREAFGISIYTQPYYANPLISTKHYWIDGAPDVYQLGITPSNSDSVRAVFDNQKLSTSTYTVDYRDNTFRFTSNTPRTGWLSLTSMQLGSIGLIDSFKVIANTTNTTYLTNVLYTDIGSEGTSSYVTFNGTRGVQGVDYTITKENNITNRALFTFNNSGTIQAYVFSEPVKAFSEVIEQVTVATADQMIFNMIQPPGNLGPYHSQVIVSRTRNNVTQRLNPPVTTYYQVANGQSLFDVSQSITFPTRSLGLSVIEVYVNGVQQPIPGIWRLNQQTNQIRFSSGTLTDGDVIAIVVKKGHDYLVENNQIVLAAPSLVGDELRIITFTNHDPDFIRTEVFKGSQTGQYRMQRSIMNSAYVWVTHNGEILSPDIDYSVDVNGYLVSLLRETQPDDDVVITTFAGNDTRLTAYRLFRDILGRTHYKRLSSENSTVLAQELYSTSTSILVEDASVLTAPDIAGNRPGVVLISGERIEFFTVSGNELGQLRRSTLGTAPRAAGYPVGTAVVDQGLLQTIQVREHIQSTATVVTSSTQVTFDVSNIAFDATANYTDQVEVRYGGRSLLKPGVTTLTHNYDMGYDSSSQSDTVVPHEFDISESKILTLNFTPVPGTRLEVISRKSTVFDATVQNFIQAKAAMLPDKY